MGKEEGEVRGERIVEGFSYDRLVRYNVRMRNTFSHSIDAAITPGPVQSIVISHKTDIVNYLSAGVPVVLVPSHSHVRVAPPH